MKMYYAKSDNNKGYYIIANSVKQATRTYLKKTQCRGAIRCEEAGIDIEQCEKPGIVYPGSAIAQIYGVEYDT